MIPRNALVMIILQCSYSVVIIEGDSSLTTPDMTLSCNPSSVNVEDGSYYVHLGDYIDWNPPRVIPRVFPFMFGHTVTLTLLETLVKVGRARRAPAR